MTSGTGKLSAEDIQRSLDASPFINFAQMRVLSVDHAHDELTMRMPMRAELERRAGTGQFHGGPIAALIDTAGDFALGMSLGGGIPTINFRVDYLRPGVGAALTATARVRRAGKTVGVVDVDVHDENGALIAIGRGCYSTKTN